MRLQTQSSDGVVTLAGIEHLPKHVRDANSIAQYVATNLDSLFCWSSPSDMD